MIRSANQSLMLDEFDDFAPSLNVSDLLNGVGEDHDVFSSLLNDYDPSTAVDYWTALLDKEEEEGAQTDSSSSQASPCSIDSGNHSPSSSSCEALNFADFPVQPAACSATARRQSDVSPRKSAKMKQPMTSASGVNFDQHVPQKQQCYRPLQPQQALQQVVLVLPDTTVGDQKANVIPIAPNPPSGGRSAARQQAQPYPTIRPKQIKLEAIDPPPTPLPQFSRVAPTPQPPPASISLHHHPVAVRAFNSVDNGCPSTESFTAKREQRKIRNREAAQLSRMRRKEMVDTMKSQLDRCVSENDRLKRENNGLRERVAGLIRENDLLRQKSGFIRTASVAKTAGVCVMALMMVVTISSGSLSSRFSPRNPSQLAPVRDYELATLKGRSLLAVEDYDQNFDDSPADTDRAPVNGTDCRKKYFNQTESNILNDVLSSWVDRHEKLRTGHVRRVKTSTFAKSSVNATIPPSNATVPRTNASATPKTKSSTAPLGRPADSWNHLDLLSGDNIRQQQLKRTRRPSNNMRRPFDLQVYSQIEMQYMQLVRALKQRDDTIYLVSMKDYLLLPATGRNSTERPRLTLVVPALSLNGSYPNQVAMMRIECEVIGTGLLHLPETLFPSFLNQTLF